MKLARWACALFVCCAIFPIFSLLVLLATVVPACASSDPNQNWVEVSSPHFTVISNAGDKQARHVAAQFEEIRALFQAGFSNLRVDSGKPTIVFALRNEDSLKLFLPSYGLNKAEKRLAGLYHPGTSKNFALVRTDITGSGTNAYHALYHEYTHSLLRSNYRGLPLWLEEGLAELYGNTVFEEKQVTFAMADINQLRLLQRTPLIPIQTLLTVDSASPIYNVQEHSGIFYAESWALVHYLSISPGVREKGLLNKFLAALQATDDPVEAANESFGDLKKLADQIEAYVRQVAFPAMRMPLHAKVEEKDFQSRGMEPAEVLGERASFLLSTGKQQEALNLLHRAEELNAKLPIVHEALGDYHYQNSAFDEADREFDKALALEPNDWVAFFFKAHILGKRSGFNRETTPQIRMYLEKTLALAPDLARAHSLLSLAYLEADETKPKAIPEAKRAVELEPGNLSYFIDLGKALSANGRVEEAKRISERAQRIASTSRDRAISASFAQQLSRSQNPSSSTIDVASDEEIKTEQTPDSLSNVKLVSLEGQITELICGHAPEVMFTLNGVDSQPLLHVKDISKIEVHVQSAVPDKPFTCAQWKGRNAVVAFNETSDTNHGEVQSINFK
jgi:tetratricopeptide (TPR) repeat protein